jgi:hypothetical protein
MQAVVVGHETPYNSPVVFAVRDVHVLPPVVVVRSVALSVG